MSRSWTNSPERTFPSRDDAALWKCWLLTFNAAIKFLEGAPFKTSDEIIREAKLFAETARIEVAELPEEGGELDRHGLQELQDSEASKPYRVFDRRLAGNLAASIHPVRHAQTVEQEIDRLISDLESGEGAGE